MKKFRNLTAGIFLTVTSCLGCTGYEAPVVGGIVEMFIQAVVYGTEKFIAHSIIGELVEKTFDEVLSGLFNWVVNKTPDKINIVPFSNDPLKGRKIGDHIYVVQGPQNSSDPNATITIPTEMIDFERVSEGSQWALTPASQNLILERLEMASIQLALLSKGYNPSRVDGIVGDKTKRAIRQYQRDNNIKPSNGELNHVTRVMLLNLKTEI